jgi:hypothetical protein
MGNGPNGHTSTDANSQPDHMDEAVSLMPDDVSPSDDKKVLKHVQFFGFSSRTKCQKHNELIIRRLCWQFYLAMSANDTSDDRY